MLEGTNRNVFLWALILIVFTDAWAIAALVTGKHAQSAIVFLIVGAVGIILSLDILRMRAK